jgi:hypothetical protein
MECRSRPLEALKRRQPIIRPRRKSAAYACALLLALGSAPALADPPNVTITSPVPNHSEDFGTSITFTATVTDDFDDPLILEPLLVWTSDLDGQIGTGASFGISTLTVGAHVITAEVTDDDGETGSDSTNVTINNAAPTADDQSVATDEDVALAITLTGSDPEGAALTFTVERDPRDGTLSGTPPNLTYTPDPEFSGTDDFEFSVNDGDLDSANATIDITVNEVNDPPTANDQSVSTDEDVALGITLTGSDPEGDTLTYVVVDQPTDGTLSGTAPNLTYTPDAEFSGSDSFTFTVNDGNSTSAEATVDITIDEVNDAPTANAQSLSTAEDTPLDITLTGSFNGSDSFTFTVDDGTTTSAEATIDITVDSNNDAPTADDQSVTTDEDVAVGITLTGSDPDGDALTYTVVDQPTDGTLTGTAPDLTYTPDADFNGTDSFTFTVDDGTTTSAEATVDITINAVNDAPTADAQSVTTGEDTPLDITLTGSDPEDDALTFTIESDPANGTLSGTAPDLTYTPDADFNGTDSFTFTVNDGDLDSAEATIDITISEGNDAPTADPQSVTTDEDVPVDITLTGSDPEDEALTFTVVEEPTNGTLSGTAPDLTYTPNLDYNGADSFTFIVNDGELDSAEATVDITINAINDAPIADAQALSTDEDTALVITLTGTDVEDDPLTFAVVVPPVNGTLSGTAPDLTYSPNADFNGTDSFTFTVNDGELTSAEATIDITVDSLNDAPFLATPIEEQVAIEGSEFSLDISANFVDADGDTLQFSATGLPASGNLVFDPDTGVFSGTPLEADARDDDPYIIVVTATDLDPETTPAETEFELNISALDRANVSLEIVVAPDPAMADDELQWTFTARNSVGPQAATNVALSGSFVGDNLTVTSNNSCTIEATVGQVTEFECALGDLPVGGTSSAVLTTATSGAGDVVVFATAASVDPTPLDPVFADNSDQLAVGVAESFSNGAVQVLGSAEVRSVAAGDVNGDGAADLVVGTAAGQSVQIFLSDGFRDFAASPVSVPDNSANEGLALADFDGDGDLDLVVANGGGILDVVYGNDGGTFTEMAMLGPTFSQGVAVGDFNNDGIADIVFAAIDGNPVYLGDGLGNFVQIATLGTANSHGVATGRIDDDAFDDIVFANTGSDSQVWISDGGTGFSEGAALPIGDALAVTIGDFDGDMRADDLAFARIPSAPGDVSSNPVLLNDDTGSFGAPVALLGVSPSHDIHAGDVNRDGRTDIVVINGVGVHQIWTANGSGFDLYAQQIVDPDAVVGVLAELGMADVGEDGGVDLAMGGALVAGLGVFLNDGFGNLGHGDAVPPVLTLNGESRVTVPSGSTYVDDGASAEDNIDGDISPSVTVTNPVNTALVGEYTVTYNVRDRAGNNADPITRTVLVAPATGTGGGGGGALGLPLLILLLMTVWLAASYSKRAIIPANNPE